MVMEKLLLVLFLLVSWVSDSEQLEASQVETLRRIQHLLNYPTALKNWKNDTGFCNLVPTSTVTVVCYEGSITQLHILGIKDTSPLPKNFSITLFFTTLVRIPSLKVVRLVSLGLWGRLPGKLSKLPALEILDLSSNYFHSGIPRAISSLKQLQTLVLDGNRLTGRIPAELGSLSLLAVLSVKSNTLDGNLPDTLQNLKNLRILSLSRNKLSGEVPDLSSLGNLQALELEDNSFGPEFPQVVNKIQSMALRNNRFSASIPEKVKSYHKLEYFDISFNRFTGPFPPELLSLPSITYLNVAGNKLTGMLFEDNPCNSALDFVDLSANMLTGTLPRCLASSPRNMIVHFSNNCLASGHDRSTQHPHGFCRNQALAAGFLPHHHRQKPASKVVLALIICGSITGGVILVCLTGFIVRSYLKAAQKTPTRSISEDASSSYTSTRYFTRGMKLGSHSLPSYRTFSLEELEVATNNFNTEAFMRKISNGQLYRGKMRDGSYASIACLKMKRNKSCTQNLIHYIELISKLRDHHLVSSLGHCFEYYLDDSSVSRLFLVFEYVSNGTLRTWTSDNQAGRKLSWTQRIAAATGIAKGLQFLHNGIHVFSNNLKITDILLDHNFDPKISSYNLPILSDNTGEKYYCPDELQSTREKLDVYDFGVILLELITGRQINTKNDIVLAQNRLEVISITGNEASRKEVVDAIIYGGDSCRWDESVKIMIGMCCRCLHKDSVERPSMDDILWNMHFSTQLLTPNHLQTSTPQLLIQ